MTEPLPVAELVHRMAGRARLRIATRRGDEKFFAMLAAGLSAHPGVTKVEAAVLTGSVVIRHVRPLDEITAAAESAGLFRVGESEATAVPPPPLEWPKLPVEPKLALAAGLGLVALWQFARGKALPPALTLLWYASRLAGLGAGAHSLEETE
jgi:hypothetical protein